MSALAPSEDDDLASQLTLIITTSPTPSAPSTELVAAVLASFRAHGAGALLRRCGVVVVLDAYDRVGATSRLKKGQVTAAEARDVDRYKANVKALVLREYGYGGHAPAAEILVERAAEAEYGSPCAEDNRVPLRILQTTAAAVGKEKGREQDRNRPRVVFVEPARRLGFGLAVRSALRLTTTPYVWVQQHDWALVADIPLRGLLGVMQASERWAAAVPNGDGVTDDGSSNGEETKKKKKKVEAPVKYVCLPSCRMLAYAVSAHVIQYPALRGLTADLTPPSSSSCSSQEQQVPLTPLFFWHDKPHLASTAHYLARVFPTRLAMPRGAFIEDTVGHRARDQMKADGLPAFRKWACWLYYPDQGRRLCLRHLHGRKWRGAEAEAAKKALWMEERRTQEVQGGGKGEGERDDEDDEESALRDDAGVLRPR